MTELDHIAVIAPDLSAGVAWVRETLGIDMPPGGAHPQMGRHNHLVGLGPDAYLEVIGMAHTNRPEIRQAAAVRLTATIATPGGVRVLN